MKENNFSAYIVPLDEEGRREWISGFTGSNGDSIVTKDKVIFILDKINFLFLVMKSLESKSDNS